MMQPNVYITAMGKYLPGEPIPNEEMERYLGQIGGKPSHAGRRVLKQNGIRTRHYAIDLKQQTRIKNSEMAANAVIDALSRTKLDLREIDYLAAATAQGDLVIPGFASMVHGELKIPPCEVATLQGTCASGMMALKSAYLQIICGEKRNAISCASELPSRLFKASRYEQQKAFQEGGKLPFEAEFLRWMLSDGAGAAVLQDRPPISGRALRIEWIEIKSYADRYDVCMYAGGEKEDSGEIGATWLDYPSFQEAAEAGTINLRQDIRMLDNIVKVGVDGFFALIDQGKVDPQAIDWVVCHYSSHFFKGEIFKLLEKGGIHLPEEKWFTNLYTKGNTGSASIYIMLEELLNEGSLKPGQKIFCMVPESGRFITAYMLLTVVEGDEKEKQGKERSAFSQSTAPDIRTDGDPLQELLVRQLARVWIDFEAKLDQVPIINRLHRGRWTVEDYRLLLRNLRQQVVEGARWIARAASNITAERFPLRSLFLQHARDEHRDYQMLERDYISVGGKLEEITDGEKNIGSEALSAWMFHRANQENPFDLLGAMFIIEGLGSRMARRWGEMIREQLGLEVSQVSFLLYHGENDGGHFEKLETAVQSGLLTEDRIRRIVKTAKVTARLYLLQLEEVGNV